MGSLCALDGPLQYPLARTDESVVHNYHGLLISDPYRWLEDPDAEEVKDFVQKQVKLTGSVLQKCDTREKLRHFNEFQVSTIPVEGVVAISP